MEENKLGVAMLLSLVSMIMYFMLRDVFVTHAQFMDFMMLMFGIVSAIISFTTLVFSIMELNDRFNGGMSVVFFISALITGACSYYFFQQIGTGEHLIIRSLGYIGGLI